MKNVILILSTLFIGGIAQANLQQANHYDCKGKNVAFTYTTTSFTGSPALNLTAPGIFGQIKDKQFLGASIEQTEMLGDKTVTVLFDVIPDMSVLRATLVLPTVQFAPNGTVLISKFNSVVLLTSYPTSIGGPALVTGPLSHTSAISVKCEAMFVVF